MNIARLVQFASNAAEGMNNFNEGAVGSNGFGFVFRDVNYEDIGLEFTSKVCNIGTMREFFEEFQNKEDPDIFQVYSDIRSDLLLIGAVKTLVPSIQLALDDLLFIVWMVVKTPDNRIFPATMYYGKTRLATGGWRRNKLSKEVGFSKYKEYFNFNPFDFTIEEQSSYAEALESALQKVPISDFEVVYRDEYGEQVMVVNDGIPNFRRISDEEYWPIEILGNGTWRYYDRFEDLIDTRLTQDDKESMKSSITFQEHKDLRRGIVERCYDDLIELAYRFNSRLAFQVLGFLLMEGGVKISDGLKGLILENSRWRDERDNLKDREDRIKRKKCLFQFRAEILMHNGDTTSY